MTTNRFGEYLTDSTDLFIIWIRWNQTQRPRQRFGQFVINNCLHDGKPWPELWYETDSAKAYNMIAEHILGID